MIIRISTILFHVEPHFYFARHWRKTRLIVASLEPQFAFNLTRASGIVRGNSHVEPHHSFAFVDCNGSFRKLQISRQRAWLGDWSSCHSRRRLDVELCCDQELVERFV